MGTKKTWQDKFFAHLTQTGNIAAACRVARISDTHVYNLRRENPEFAERMATAIDSALDNLEAAAFERAKSHSDTLLIFLLKAHRPEKYRENTKVELSGNVDITNHYEVASSIFDRLLGENPSIGTAPAIPSDSNREG